MADYIDRQEAIDVLHGYFDGMLETDTICPKDLYNLFEVIPSADVVEVVRCKDCRYWHEAPAADGFNSCEMDALIRHEMFFCANGERKDD